MSGLIHSGYKIGGNKESTSWFYFFKLFLDPFEIAIDIGSHWAKGGEEIA